MTTKLPGLFLLLLSNIIVSCTRPSWQSGPPKHYFVSINGDDANPGTKKKPLKTVAKIERLTLEPGDGVFFKGGEIFDGTLTLHVNGSEEKPIEFIKTFTHSISISFEHLSTFFGKNDIRRLYPDAIFCFIFWRSDLFPKLLLPYGKPPLIARRCLFRLPILLRRI